jgi:hypothetical protein
MRKNSSAVINLCETLAIEIAPVDSLKHSNARQRPHQRKLLQIVAAI